MTERSADHAVMPQLLDRWSPRAFDPRPIDDEALMTILEAARWAPSSRNRQPWRFVYAMRGDAHWDALFSTLMPMNQLWVQNASALIFILSDKFMENDGNKSPSHSHSFDAGAAWMALALQAHSMGLISHAMTGVDMESAAKLLNFSDDFRVEAAIAVGYMGDPASLPEQWRAREVKSGRRPLAETVFHGPVSD